MFQLLSINNKFKEFLWRIFSNILIILSNGHQVNNPRQDSFILPVYPQVKTSGCEIIIVWSEENQEHWGEEENQDTAKKIAEEMNLELKVTGYVKTILGDTINRIYDDLLNLGIPHNIAKNALHDGHLALLHIIITIDNAKKNGQPQVVDPKESK